ncbi:MAG: hypothetical protein B6I24_08165 [Bacteroidetes bacterium 4572_128]|nr:MAG: hypothetical protein B6I24_08165 [Bacteroidetes bacterium 4572_128]
MKNTFIIIIIFINFKFIFSQENNHFKDFKIKISGFVSYDAWYHTRQYVSARDGLVSLYPKNIELDKNGDDINEDGYLNAVSMKSRIRFDMKEIEILNGKTSAILEGDFTGTENSNANGFFILEAIPNVMALHTGVPIQLLNRTPQLRITKKYKNFTIMMSAITQRDFKSPGPLKKDEIKYSSEFLQNAKIPN